MTLEMHRRHLVRYICALLCVIVVASLLFNRERSQQTSAPLHLAGQDGSHGKELLLVQAVFRHGARTPLANIYFPDTKWSHCGPNEGVKLALHDENGGKSSPPPPIIDTDSPLLPGGCRQGELTKNGYVMAKDLGQWLRTRFIGELGFLSPDFKACTMLAVPYKLTCIVLHCRKCACSPSSAQLFTQLSWAPVGQRCLLSRGHGICRCIKNAGRELQDRPTTGRGA
eukprot:1138356-Pelagomonas_calceolata.AAC.1